MREHGRVGLGSRSPASSCPSRPAPRASRCGTPWWTRWPGGGPGSTSVRAEDGLTFPGLRVALEGAPEMRGLGRGRGAVPAWPAAAARESARGGYYPRTYARLLGTVFQGETKKARLELSPLRYDADHPPGRARPAPPGAGGVRRARDGREVAGRIAGTTAPGRPRPLARGVVAQLVTGQAGLYRVSVRERLPRRAARVSWPAPCVSPDGDGRCPSTSSRPGPLRSRVVPLLRGRGRPEPERGHGLRARARDARDCG